ncbi:MAG: helix-turn-helix domain-containing protein [Candidatus Woesearchaeota archaeon]|jgi:sugar-specific transcriptional regulator TrmB
MDAKVLEKIGMSKAEIKVYLALLELGSVPSGKIVHETNFRKSTVYESIKRLQNKGLVSYIIKDGMKHFEAANPERVIDFIEEEKRKLDETKNEAEKFVLQLKKGLTGVKPSAEAQVLEGIEGFKTMRRDVLRNARKEHLLIGAISREDEIMPGFFEEWNKARQKKKIMLRILHKESARTKAMAKKEFMGKCFETKFLSEELESPAVINIYGDRVVNVIWKGDYPLCFMLINKEIADSYRKYFEYLWKSANP